jgi:hypothetical protein
VSLWFRVRSAGFSLRQGTVPVLYLRHTRRGSNNTTSCASSGLQEQRLRNTLRCCSPRVTASQIRSSAAARTAALSCTAAATLAPQCQLSRRPGSTAGSLLSSGAAAGASPRARAGARRTGAVVAADPGSLTLVDWNHESHLHREAHDICTASAICRQTDIHRERERERGGGNRGRGGLRQRLGLQQARQHCCRKDTGHIIIPFFSVSSRNTSITALYIV